MTVCIPTISWILGPLWLLSQRAVLAFSNLEGGEWTSVRSSWICIGLCGCTKGAPLGALKTKKGGSCWVSYLGAEKSIKTWLPSNVCSANLKCFLGWQHNTKCPNQDTGLVQSVLVCPWLSLFQVWHCVCTIVCFTQTRFEGSEVSHWPECFLSSWGMFTEVWCFSKPLIRSTPCPLYL